MRVREITDGLTQRREGAKNEGMMINQQDAEQVEETKRALEILLGFLPENSLVMVAYPDAGGVKTQFCLYAPSVSADVLGGMYGALSSDFKDSLGATMDALETPAQKNFVSGFKAGAKAKAHGRLSTLSVDRN